MSLKIYPVVLDLVRRLSPVIRVLRSRSSALADQMERALISVPLNVAEGAYSRGKNRHALSLLGAGSRSACAGRVFLGERAHEFVEVYLHRVPARAHVAARDVLAFAFGGAAHRLGRRRQVAPR